MTPVTPAPLLSIAWIAAIMRMLAGLTWRSYPEFAHLLQRWELSVPAESDAVLSRERSGVPDRPEDGSASPVDYPKNFPRLPDFAFPVTSQDDLERKVALLSRHDLYPWPEERASGITVPVRTASPKLPD